MKIKIAFWMLLIIVFFSACKNDDDAQPDISADFDAVAIDEYYNNDPIPAAFNSFYGKWKVTSTSGGFSGGGYTADFDYLLAKPNGIFGILRNDSLLTTGQIKIVEQSDSTLWVDFIPQQDSLSVYILLNNRQLIDLSAENELSLFSDCCDQFDTHLEWVE